MARRFEWELRVRQTLHIIYPLMKGAWLERRERGSYDIHVWEQSEGIGGSDLGFMGHSEMKGLLGAPRERIYDEINGTPR